MSLSKKLWILFISFVKVSTLGIGGGLAMLPIIEDYFVKKYNLITNDDLLDYIALTQSMPGIIATNMSCFVGMKVAGLLGAIAATIGMIFPPFIIINIVVILLHKVGESVVLNELFMGIRAAVAALILIAALKMLKKIFIGKYAQTLTILSFLLLAFTKVDVILVIVLGIILGFIVTFIKLSKLKKQAEVN